MLKLRASAIFFSGFQSVAVFLLMIYSSTKTVINHVVELISVNQAARESSLFKMFLTVVGANTEPLAVLKFPLFKALAS